MKENINQTKALVDFIKASADVEVMVGGQIFDQKHTLDTLSADRYYNTHEDLIDFLVEKNK